MGVARSGLGWLLAKYGALLLSFGSVLYFTRALENPTTVLGLFQVFESIVGIAMIAASGGLAKAVTKRISERRNESRLVGATAVLSLGALLILTSIGLAATDYLQSYFKMGFVVVALLLVTIWAHQVSDMSKAILQGASRVGRAGGIEFFEMFVRLIAQVGLVYLGYELIGLLAGAAIGTVSAAVVAVAMIPYDFARPAREHLEELFSFTKYTYPQGFTDKVYANVDTFVIAGLLSSEAVALYNIPFRLALVLDTFVNSISGTILPEISHQDVANNSERVEEVLKDAVIFATILAIPATVGVAILAKPIIVTLFTAEFAESATVAILAMAIQIPESLRTVFNSVVIGVDRPDVTLRASLLLVGINVPLDLLLVPTIGIEGAAIATLAGVTFSGTYLGWALVSVLELDWRFFPFRPLTAQVAAAGVMGAVVLWLRSVLELDPILKLSIIVAIGIIVYWALLVSISSRTRRRLWGIAADVLPVRKQ
jgi:O-antigen/teichoic acid export membrane protein